MSALTDTSCPPFWALGHPADSPAVREDGRGWIGYGELAALADAAVQGWPARSVFALRFTPTVKCLALYLGALRQGHVALLQDAAAAAALNDGVSAHFGIEAVYDGLAGCWTVPPPAAAPVATWGRVGLLMSTSGSTGSPKLVKLSRENLAANAGSIVSYLGIVATDCAISLLPLHYSYGLSVLNTHLAAGARFVLSASSPMQAAHWALHEAHGVTSLAAVPTLWRLMRRLRFERMRLPGLHTLTQAGGRLDAEEVQWLADVAEAAGRRLFVMYGQTEATARIAYLPPALLRHKPGSIGQAIPGGELSLVDGQGVPLAGPDVEGELVYRGPNVMLGYATMRGDLVSEAAIEQLRTGDLGRRDADGHYYITGRLGRFIKLFGNRFALDEVERHLRALGHDAAVVGRDDLMQVAVRADSPVAEQLREQLLAHYRLHHSAVQILALPSLPRSAAGKLLYAEVRAAFESPAATAAA